MKIRDSFPHALESSRTTSSAAQEKEPESALSSRDRLDSCSEVVEVALLLCLCGVISSRKSEP